MNLFVLKSAQGEYECYNEIIEGVYNTVELLVEASDNFDRSKRYEHEDISLIVEKYKLNLNIKSCFIVEELQKLSPEDEDYNQALNQNHIILKKIPALEYCYKEKIEFNKFLEDVPDVSDLAQIDIVCHSTETLCINKEAIDIFKVGEINKHDDLHCVSNFKLKINLEKLDLKLAESELFFPEEYNGCPEDRLDDTNDVSLLYVYFNTGKKIIFDIEWSSYEEGDGNEWQTSFVDDYSSLYLFVKKKEVMNK